MTPATSSAQFRNFSRLPGRAAIAAAGVFAAAGFTIFPPAALAQTDTDAPTAQPVCESSDNTITCTFTEPGEHEFELPAGVTTVSLTATGQAAAESQHGSAETATRTVEGVSGTLYAFVADEEITSSEVRTDHDDPETRLILAAGAGASETSLGDEIEDAAPDALPSVVISYATEASASTAAAAPATCRGLCIDDTIFRFFEQLLAEREN